MHSKRPTLAVRLLVQSRCCGVETIFDESIVKRGDDKRPRDDRDAACLHLERVSKRRAVSFGNDLEFVISVESARLAKAKSDSPRQLVRFDAVADRSVSAACANGKR